MSMPMNEGSGPLYFCSLCKKPFSQETSCTRHIKYCRRRAGQQRQTRPKACYPCRSAKTKCDFRSPCCRCTDKQLVCSYGNDQAPVFATGQNGGIVVPSHESVPHRSDRNAHQKPQTSTQSRRGTQTASANPQETLLITLDDLTDIDVFDHAHVRYTSPAGHHRESNQRKDLSLPHIFVQTPRGILDTVDNGLARTVEPSSEVLIAQDIFPVAFPPSLTIGRPLRTPSLLSNGCRNFLLSIIGSYPRMIAQENNLPPFIHPHGCKLHFDDRTYGGTFDEVPPVKQLEACISTARMLASRPSSDSMNDFIWRIIDSEHKYIVDNMNNFSLGETIAALQSTMLYGTMRVAISGRSYSEINSSIVRTMEKLSFRCSTLTARPFSTRHTRVTRPTWEEWICEETRRRISVTCFLIALTIPNDPSNPIVNPNNHVLPASKALWEARTRAEWERLYIQQQVSDGAPRLETVGDFIIAKLGGIGRSKSDARANLVDDMIGKWYAEMDGLGMMLAAVVASL